MHLHKRQDIVEFALLLPVFLVIICGIIYVGFFFGDYMTLSTLARNAAREASVIQEYDDKGHNNYDDIANAYGKMIYESQNREDNEEDTPNQKAIITKLYLYQKDTNPMTVKGPKEHLFSGGPENSVEVVIPMKLNKDADFMGSLSKLGILSDKPYNIIYYMYDETYQSTNTGSGS